MRVLLCIMAITSKVSMVVRGYLLSSESKTNLSLTIHRSNNSEEDYLSSSLPIRRTSSLKVVLRLGTGSEAKYLLQHE